MKYYPSYLPLPQIEYSSSNDNRTVQSNFESGRISQRSLATTQRDVINVSFQYNLFQLGVWESFVQTSLANGSLEFTINLPDSITQVMTATVVILSSGRYSIDAVSGAMLWKVTATFIKQNKVCYTQEELDDLEALEGLGVITPEGAVEYPDLGDFYAAAIGSATVETTIEANAKFAFRKVDGSLASILWSNIKGLFALLTGNNTFVGNQIITGTLNVSDKLVSPNVVLQPWDKPLQQNIRCRSDYFAGNSLVSGSIGEWDWYTYLTGTSSIAAGGGNDLAAASGKSIVLSTGATASSISCLYLPQNQSEIWHNIATTFHIAVRPTGNANSGFNDSAVWVGYTDQTLGGYQTMVFGWDRAISANFLIKYLVGATQTYYDTGIACSDANEYWSGLAVTIIGGNYDSGAARVVVTRSSNYNASGTTWVFTPASLDTRNVFNHHYSISVSNNTAVDRKVLALGIEINHPSAILLH